MAYPWDDRYSYERGSDYYRPSGGGKKSYKSTTSLFDDGQGTFLVMSPQTKRTFRKDVGGAIDHAADLIYKGNGDEFLILKVVGRVKKKRPPVEFTRID